MRGVFGHIELAGFVITKDEWQSMDPAQRAQLLRAATRRDEPWVPSPPVRAGAVGLGETRAAPPPLRPSRSTANEPAVNSNDAYELYEITAVPA